jgi:hypothetical protein
MARKCRSFKFFASAVITCPCPEANADLSDPSAETRNVLIQRCEDRAIRVR